MLEIKEDGEKGFVKHKVTLEFQVNNKKDARILWGILNKPDSDQDDWKQYNEYIREQGINNLPNGENVLLWYNRYHNKV